MTRELLRHKPEVSAGRLAQGEQGILDGGWISTEELATRLGVDPSTLRRWRTATPRQGPPFVRLSARRTLYGLTDVERWLADSRVDPRNAA